MLKIEIEFEDLDERLTGFNMGHMTFHGNIGTVTSKNKTPSQAMMILLSISELLSGLRRLTLTKSTQYEFIGADSSFIVYFDKLKNGKISVRSQGQEIIRSDAKNILTSVFRDVNAFLSDVLPNLPKDDLGRKSLLYSLPKYEAFLKEISPNE